jgi:hypothetical protein
MTWAGIVKLSVRNLNLFLFHVEVGNAAERSGINGSGLIKR